MRTWNIIRNSLTGILLGVIAGAAICIVMTVNRLSEREGNGIYRNEAVPANITGTQDGGISYSFLSNEDMAALEGLLTEVDAGGIEAEPEKEAEKLYNENMQVTEGSIRIQDKILRFHVKANSNSEEDIALKYMVRDTVLQFISDKLDEADSKISAMEILYRYSGEIQEEAEKCIRDAGFDYDVEVSVGASYFPIRRYGDIVLPAGTYDALTIKIGKAEGENFWCMLYPAICFTTDSAAVVDSESKKELKRVLTEEEYREVFVDKEAREEGRVKVGFWFLSLFH